jgi:hypothetical protein
MADDFTDLLGSREPARTRIKGFQPDTFVPKSNAQLRPVSNAQAVPTTFGHQRPLNSAKVPSKLDRGGK